VVWCPVGKSRAVGLHMSLAKFQLILGVQVGDIGLSLRSMFLVDWWFLRLVF
jgi:hypothetical protein